MRNAIVILIFAVTIYALFDAWRATDEERLGLNRWVWVAAIVLVPAIGALAWLVLSRWGRPRPTQRPTGPLAPDDDPDFLRGLDRRTREDDGDART